MKRQITEFVKTNYLSASGRLILLDYDGTLVPHSNDPTSVFITGEVTSAIMDLASDPDNEVMLITGRGNKDIESLIDNIPIDIISNHGAMIRESGVWKSMISDPCIWKAKVREVFKRYSQVCPGTFTEEKAFSMAWHYRTGCREALPGHSRRLLKELKSLAAMYDLKLLDSNMVVEVMNISIGKGEAVKRLLSMKNYGFIFAAGDDTTDEEMFEALKDNKEAFTFRVGHGRTAATYSLDDIDELLKLIKYLTE